MRLSAAEKAVLAALVSGSRLQSHRHLDGRKEYALHTLDDTRRPVAVAVVERLRDHGLIQSNMKFPAATYLLTSQGQQVANTLTPAALHPLTARTFSRR
ncbi:MAG: hypothetical protein IT329_04625 [Caldilineaceae bacterium]|nr:hypothetical protein [Caldilineaceae bacterium]